MKIIQIVTAGGDKTNQRLHLFQLKSTKLSEEM